MNITLHEVCCLFIVRNVLLESSKTRHIVQLSEVVGGLETKLQDLREVARKALLATHKLNPQISLPVILLSVRYH